MAKTTHRVETEVVIIGYYDPRIGAEAPIGFAVKTGPRVVVHYGYDLDELDLPKTFSFTAKQLPNIVYDKCKNGGIGNCSLHKHLLKTCFSSLGSFRCWQPITQELDPADLDGFVTDVQKVVDQGMQSYLDKLVNYQDSCKPHWQRIPEKTFIASMPPLVPFPN